MGKEGLKEVGEQSYHKAHYLAAKLDQLAGYQVLNKENFFNEFVLKSEKDSTELINELMKADIIAGYDLKELGSEGILVCVTEKRTKTEMDKFQR